MSLGTEARRHLRAHHHGVLSTISRALEGYPFGSIVPFVLDARACPVIFVSRLAEHTRNLGADPRLSLLVHARDAAGGDVQGDARVTLMGKACAIAQADSAGERYLRYFPAARAYLGLDFNFYRIEPVTLRLVAGFGKIHWISREAYAPPAYAFAEHKNDIITQINRDHAQLLRDCCRLQHQRMTADTQMAGIDCDGFDVRVNGEILRFDFAGCVRGAAQAHAALTVMARTTAAS